MKIINAIFISIFLVSCISQKEITLPIDMKNIIELEAIGNDSSWKIDIGPYRVYDISDRNERVLVIDPWNLNDLIRSFEYRLNTIDNNTYLCYVEYPLTTIDDQTFRCIYNNLNNPSDYGTVNDSILYFLNTEIDIYPYYNKEINQTKSKNDLVGYLFLEDNVKLGLVDIYNTYNEKIWIDPSLNIQKQNYLIALSTSYILKYRKWYVDRVQIIEDQDSQKL